MSQQQLISELPDWVPAEAWAEFVKMRKGQKKPMTDYARKLVLRKLDELRLAGQDVQAVLDQSILKCWLDVFPVKVEVQQVRTSGGAWWAADTTIIAMGERLGLRPNNGESMPAFKARIQAVMDNGGKAPQVPSAAMTMAQTAPKEPEKRSARPEGMGPLKDLVKRVAPPSRIG